MFYNKWVKIISAGSLLIVLALMIICKVKNLQNKRVQISSYVVSYTFTAVYCLIWCLCNVLRYNAILDLALGILSILPTIIIGLLFVIPLVTKICKNIKAKKAAKKC